jgi:hypothetical protein
MLLQCYKLVRSDVPLQAFANYFIDAIKKQQL